MLEIIERLNRKRITAKRSIGIKEFPFLKDHKFGDKIVVPAVFFFELFFQACINLFEDLRINKIIKADFTGLIELSKEKTTEMYIQADFRESIAEKTIVDGEISYLFTNKNGSIKRKKKTLDISAELENADSGKNAQKKPKQRGQFIFPFSSCSEILLEKEQIYKNMIDFGPTFSNLSYIYEMRHPEVENIIRGAIQKSGQEFLKNNQNSFLSGDIFIRDSSYHICAIWNMFHQNKFSIPFQMKNINFYSKLEPNQTYYCIGKYIKSSNESSSYSLMIINSDGYLVEDYGEIRYTHKLKVNEAVSLDEWSNGKYYSKIHTFNGLFSKMNDKAVFGIMSVDLLQRNEDFLLKYLSEEELAIYQRYKVKRKMLQYLGGKILVKICLSKLFNMDIRQLKESLTKDEAGKPLVKTDGPLSNVVPVSISHSGNYAVCSLKKDMKTDIGIDIEQIKAKIEKLQSKFVNEQDIEILKKGGYFPLSIEMLTRIWTAKECVAKMVVDNLFEVFRKVSIQSLEADKMVLEYKSTDVNTLFECLSSNYDDYIISIASQI